MRLSENMQRLMALKEVFYYLEFPGEGGTPSMQGHMGKHQVGSGSRSRRDGKAWATAFTEVLARKARLDKVNRSGLAGLNNVSKLWTVGVGCSCLVPSPG